MSRFKFRAWDGKRMHIINNSPEELWPVLLNEDKGDWKVMQCTGWEDARDKLIFEGDICDDGQGNLAVIEWVEDHCQFLWMHSFEAQEIGDWCIIVGNIYEHPELLEA